MHNRPMRPRGANGECPAASAPPGHGAPGNARHRRFGRLGNDECLRPAHPSPTPPRFCLPIGGCRDAVLADRAPTPPFFLVNGGHWVARLFPTLWVLFWSGVVIRLYYYRRSPPPPFTPPPSLFLLLPLPLLTPLLLSTYFLLSNLFPFSILHSLLPYLGISESLALAGSSGWFWSIDCRIQTRNLSPPTPHPGEVTAIPNLTLVKTKQREKGRTEEKKKRTEYSGCESKRIKKRRRRRRKERERGRDITLAFHPRSSSFLSMGNWGC